MSEVAKEFHLDSPPLPTGWDFRELENILLSNGLSYGIVQPGSNIQDGIPILRVKNIKAGRVVLEDILRVDRDVESSYQRTRLRGGEVLLTLVGSVGESAIAPTAIAGWNVARAVAVIRTVEATYSKWVQLCLRSELAQQYMHTRMTTTVQATLNLRDVRRIPVIWPPAAEREGIVSIIGALDNKISVNERIAQISRELGIANFRAQVAADDAEDVAVSDIAEFISRGVAPRYADDQDQLRVLNQKCIRDGRVNLLPSRRTVSERVPRSKYLRMNDVLVNSTGVGTLGRVARWTGSEACTVDSHVTIVRFDTTKTDAVCAGFAVLTAEPEITIMGEGSTGQTELSRAKMATLRITLPSRERATKLRPLLDALERRGEKALEESRGLAELRDALLPRLMSGEIRVRDAEKIAEDVT